MWCGVIFDTRLRDQKENQVPELMALELNRKKSSFKQVKG